MTRRLLLAAIVLLAVTALRAEGPRPQAYAGFVEDLERAMVRQMRGEDIAGAGIVLVDGETVIWQKTFGYAAAEEKRPLRPETPMAVGSFTKLLTTIAVLQQVDAGRLALDAPVTDYLDLTFEAREAGWRAPTVRELLTHHGGFPPNRYAQSFREAPPTDLWLPDPLPLARPPGTIYAYSQLGFQVAGRLVEAVTGRPYAAYVASEILAPLGMNGSGFGPTAATALPHDERRREETPIFSRDMAALGLFAAVEDLGRLLAWVTAGRGEPLLSDAAFEAMTSVQNAAVLLDLDNRAGLGWQMTNTGNHGIERILRMNTTIFRHRGLMLVAPDERLGVVLVSNSSAAGDLVQERAREALDGLLERKAGIAPPPEEPEPPARLGLPRGASPADMAARYSTPLGELLAEGTPEAYVLTLAGRKFGLERREDGWYELSFKLLGLVDLRFSLLKEVLLRPVALAGRRVLLAHFRGSHLLLGSAVPASEPRPSLAAWEGDYRIANPDAVTESLELEEASLEYEDGRLYLRYELPTGVIGLEPRVPLVPFGPASLYVPGLGLNTGDTVRLVREGELRILEFSGWRLVAR